MVRHLKGRQSHAHSLDWACISIHIHIDLSLQDQYKEPYTPILYIDIISSACMHPKPCTLKTAGAKIAFD